jgi:hypothetical protein
MGRRRGQSEAFFWHDVYAWRPPENTSPRQQRRLKHASFMVTIQANNPSNGAGRTAVRRALGRQRGAKWRRPCARVPAHVLYVRLLALP